MNQWSKGAFDKTEAESLFQGKGDGEKKWRCINFHITPSQYITARTIEGCEFALLFEESEEATTARSRKMGMVIEKGSEGRRACLFFSCCCELYSSVQVAEEIETGW